MCSETARLEGLILRSQLLVMLQRRVFCDEQGTPLNLEHDDRAELELETDMRTFFRWGWQQGAAP
jgi:chloride channel 7